MPYTTTQTDDENVYDWASIQTTFNDDDTVQRIFTVFDSGLTQTESNFGFYTGNYDTTLQLDDSASQLYDWETRRIVTSAEGVLKNDETRFDSGLNRAEAYTDGILSSVVESDFTPGNDYDWTRKQSFYTDGALYRQTISFDNGQSEVGSYSNGVLTTRMQQDSADANNWDTIQTNYDTISGQANLRITTYDDGIKRYESFDGDRRTSTVLDDRDNVRSWAEIETIYGPEGQAQKTTTYDNGVVRVDEKLQSGKFQMVSKHDVNDTQRWDQIEVHYNDGDVLETQTVTTYDDGTVRQDYVRDGIRLETRQYDDDFEGNGVKSWSEINTYYDDAGTLAFRETRYDNDAVRTEEYREGVIERIVQDNSQSNLDTLQVQTYFDQGVIAFRETDYRDGSAKVEEYREGVRERITQTDGMDNAKRWDSIDTFFDENGDLAFRETTYDSGVVRVEEFDAGQRLVTRESDVNDTQSWTTKDTYYDEAGQLAGRHQVYDNGVERNEYMLDDGTRLVGQADTNDTFNWAAKEQVYDANGKLTSSYTNYDNQDELVDLFVEGERQARFETDGDASQDWAYRMTQYDENGTNGVITTYDDINDVPDEYLPYFNVGQVYG